MKTIDQLKKDLVKSLAAQNKAVNGTFALVGEIYKLEPSKAFDALTQVQKDNGYVKGDSSYKTLANYKTLVKKAFEANLTELESTVAGTNDKIDQANGVTQESVKAKKDQAKAEKAEAQQKQIADAVNSAMQGAIKIADATNADLVKFATQLIDELMTRKARASVTTIQEHAGFVLALGHTSTKVEKIKVARKPQQRQTLAEQLSA